MAGPLTRCLRVSLMSRGLNVHHRKGITLLKDPYRCITQENKQWGKKHSYGYSKFAHDKPWLSPLRRAQLFALIFLITVCLLDWKYYLPKIKRRWRKFKRAIGLQVPPHAHPLLLERDKIPEGWLGLSDEEIEDLKEVAALWYSDEEIEEKPAPLYYRRKKSVQTESLEDRAEAKLLAASDTALTNAPAGEKPKGSGA